jgi:hypothetical protein
MVLKQLVVFADSDVSLRLKTVADQAATSSITVSLVPLRIRRSTVVKILSLNDLWEGVVVGPARPRGARPGCMLAEYTCVKK